MTIENMITALEQDGTRFVEIYGDDGDYSIGVEVTRKGDEKTAYPELLLVLYGPHISRWNVVHAAKRALLIGD